MIQRTEYDCYRALQLGTWGILASVDMNITITFPFSSAACEPASLLGILTRYSLLLLSFGMINNPVRMDVLRLAYRFLTS